MQATKSLEIVHSDMCGSMRDVTLMVDSTSTGSDLEMLSSKRYELPMAVEVDFKITFV